MNILRYFPPKSPNSVVPYSFDWTEWLAKASSDGEIPADTITGTPVVTASGSGLTITGIFHDDSVVTFTVSGGLVDTTYTVGCKITTSLGLVDERFGVIQVFNRS